jgi:hypothetical protein
MKHLIIKALLILSLFSVALISFSCSSEDKGEETANVDEGQLWTCGMHPEVIVDEPQWEWI